MKQLFHSRSVPRDIALIVAVALSAVGHADQPDLILLDGNILTVDKNFSRATAIAIQGERILAVGSSNAIRKLAGPRTQLVTLNGHTVIPGLIETHVHAQGVGLSATQGTYVELRSIAEIQRWLRTAAADTAPGKWIRVPRTDITRLAERRHPTPAELDAGCNTHPVVFNAARKNVLNTLAFKELGVTPGTREIGGDPLLRDTSGNPRLVAGGDAAIRSHFPQPTYTDEQRMAALAKVHQIYNTIGITSVFERAHNAAGFALYQRMHQQGQLTVRSTHTIRQQFRTADQLISFTKSSGLMTGQGDDWVRVGPLKISVDGGIHWGTTHLREPYGRRRIRFYALEGIQQPGWAGESKYSISLMHDLFREGHRLGWQMCCHVTGDAGVDGVLTALERAHADVPLADRRFTLIHAYFPVRDSIRRARALGLCVDTQPYLYYRDAEAMHEVYGPTWAERFIGVGDWIRGGLPTSINSDHMIGMDPNHAMNSFNPFLLMQIAITRRTDAGNQRGPHQAISRQEALRCYTIQAAYLGFDETRKGSLEAGKLADLVVLDRDYLACPTSEIKDIQVIQTMVGGKFVYERR